jgi:hypothetical protein
MKIIGKSEDGYILTASKDDVAAIEGLYSHQNRYEIGDIIDIEGLFRKYTIVDNALKDIDKLRHTSELLNNAVDWIQQFKGEKK